VYYIPFLLFFGEREREKGLAAASPRGQSHYVHVESYGHQQSTKRRWSGRFVGQRFNPKFGFLKKTILKETYTNVTSCCYYFTSTVDGHLCADSVSMWNNKLLKRNHQVMDIFFLS
jgi:hypothetical protein